MATQRRKIEIFSAGCPLCDSVVDQVRDKACPSCEITVLDMSASQVAARAKDLGVSSIPAVAVDGELVDCCRNRGVDLDVLAAAGLGQPLT